jgi:MFS family permease
VTTPAAARPPLLGRLLPSRVFYGWWVTLGCGLVVFVGVGIGFYVLPLFLGPLQEQRGWSNAEVSGATGLYFTVSGLTSAAIGRAVDRGDPRRYMVVGTVLLGLSLAVVGHVRSLWQLYLVYPVMAAAFAMAANLPTNSILTRWWITRRGRAMSVAFSFVSLGGALFAPLGRRLLDSGGLELAAPVLGGVVVAVALPVILFVLVSDPGQLGLEPDDGLPAPAGSAPAGDQRRPWTRAEAARTGAFWAILVGFLLVLVCQVGFLTHQVAFLETRFSASIAALAVSVTALGSAAARIIVGGFADRVEKRRLTVGLVLLQATAVLGLQATSNHAVNLALVLVFGFTMGNIFMMQALLVGEIYGITSFATVYGMTAAAGQTASGLGPILVGGLEEATGGYRVPFLLTAGLTVLGAVVLSQAKAPAPVRQPAGTPVAAPARP